MFAISLESEMVLRPAYEDWDPTRLSQEDQEELKLVIGCFILWTRNTRRCWRLRLSTYSIFLSILYELQRFHVISAAHFWNSSNDIQYIHRQGYHRSGLKNKDNRETNKIKKEEKFLNEMILCTMSCKVFSSLFCIRFSWDSNVSWGSNVSCLSFCWKRINSLGSCVL